MSVKGFDKLYLLLGGLVLAAAVGLFFGWRSFFPPDSEGGPPDGGTVRLARIVRSQGSVLCRQASSVEWKPIREGDYLSERDKLKTLNESSATIEFESGSILNVKQNSLIVVERLVKNNTAIELVGGKLNAQIERADGTESFMIKARTAQAEVYRETVRVD